MAKKILEVLKRDILFHVFSLTSIGLLIASFVLPPTGAIDPSVFAGVGEIFAFAALYEVHRAIDRGMGAKVEHNNTSVTISGNDNDNDNES